MNEIYVVPARGTKTYQGNRGLEQITIHHPWGSETHLNSLNWIFLLIIIAVPLQIFKIVLGEQAVILFVANQKSSLPVNHVACLQRGHMAETVGSECIQCWK